MHHEFDFSQDKEAIIFILTNISPNGVVGVQNVWQAAKCIPFKKIKKISNSQLVNFTEEKYNNILRFMAAIESLPSSEAFCECVFSRMRKLFPKDRELANDDLIRAEKRG